MPFTSSYNKRLVREIDPVNLWNFDEAQTEDNLTVDMSNGQYDSVYGNPFAIAYQRIGIDDTLMFRIQLPLRDVLLTGCAAIDGLAALSNGNLLVAWRDGDGNHWASRYAPNGDKVGSDWALPFHDRGNAPNLDLGITVAALQGGGFLRLVNTAEDTLILERFNAIGTFVSSTQVDINAEDEGGRTVSDVRELSDGGYVVVFDNFLSALAGLDGQKDVRIAVFNADGTTRVPDRHVFGSDDGGFYDKPQVAALHDGGFAIVCDYESSSFSTPDSAVRLAVCDADGNVVRALRINAVTVREVDIAVLDSGDIIVAFVGQPRIPGGGVEPYGVWAQMYSARGVPIGGPPFLISENVLDTELNVAALLNGSAVITWNGTDADLLGSDGVLGQVVQLTRDVEGSDVNDVFQGTVLDETVLALGGNDRVFGGIGRDTLVGGTGFDLLDGGVGADVLQGGDAADTLLGGEGRDTLLGGAGDDRLEGGEGIDTLDGGAGADTYILSDYDAGYDRVSDTGVAPQGVSEKDTVLIKFINPASSAFFPYRLGEGIENARVATTGDLGLVGNDESNALIGNVDRNRLEGGSGLDTLTGGDGDDTYVLGDVALIPPPLPGAGTYAYDRVVETNPHTTNPDLADGGIDTVEIAFIGTEIGRYVLGDFLDNLLVTASGVFELVGNSLANVLTGNNDANRLDGAGGRDTLQGRGGDDTYILTGTTSTGGPFPVFDTVIEDANQGTDTVIVQKLSAFGLPNGYTLTANVERGIIAGSLNFSLTGNASANDLQGNGAANTLRGLDGDDTANGGAGNDSLAGGTGNDRLLGGIGNDTLDGGSGNDTLTGADGADVFVFSGALNNDRITDFESALDRIDLTSLRDENAGLAITLTQLLLTQVAGTARIRLDLDRNGVADLIDLDEDGVADQMRIDLPVTSVVELTAAVFLF